MYKMLFERSMKPYYVKVPEKRAQIKSTVARESRQLSLGVYKPAISVSSLTI